jgi:UDP-glucose:(heptosyl)LPS alpha-1,3-glucosyltransferase
MRNSEEEFQDTIFKSRTNRGRELSNRGYADAMNIAFCYESVLPTRGGCETYISDLARRLVADGHEVHLYACRWDAERLPASMQYHRLKRSRGPRFLRPWRFARACELALRDAPHHVSIGFDKTWGQDVLYPQGGLHVASADHNIKKYPWRRGRLLARFSKWFDVAYWSYRWLERKQYLHGRRPLIIVNSNMVRHHFQHYYRVSAGDLRVIRSSIDPGRFTEQDRPKRRIEWRQQHGIRPEEIVGLFAAMNYRLKGLDPLLHAVQRLPQSRPFRLVVVGNPRNGHYQRLAQRLGVGDRVHFVGYCADMRNSYFAADFLVHPTFYDPCSLVVLEALACGLPVITSRFNGASELLGPPKDGYVIDDPHDHERLAWSIEQLFDPERRLACAQAARRTAAQWTFEQHYQHLLEVLYEAEARKRAA